MKKIVEKILIKTDLNKTYNTYSDILLWINILDNVEDIQIITDKEDSQDFYYTIRKGNYLETVRTVRKLYPTSKIEMEQLVTPPGFKRMKGIWDFEEVQQGTVVTATRIVELDEIANSEQTLNLLRTMLKHNLEMFKKYLETYQFDVSQVIPAPVNIVSELFWDISEWKKIWKPIINVTIISQDEKQQIFQMDILMNNNIEQIETKQIREDDRISFCSTKPVSTMKQHQGEWIFSKIDENHTKVTASRAFQFSDDYRVDCQAEYFEKFKIRVDNILLSFKEHFNFNQEGTHVSFNRFKLNDRPE
jgi:ribosome-associated toxin RatA of RatAB toxin-antitoxin module